MKCLRPALSTLLLSALFVGPAFAQGRQSPEQMKERMAAQVQETVVALELEGDRAETVKTILNAQMEKRIEMQTEMMAARGNRQGQGGNRGGMGAMREKMEALDAETLELLGQVLSPEELAKYAELAASQRGGRRRGASQIQ